MMTDICIHDGVGANLKAYSLDSCTSVLRFTAQTLAYDDHKDSAELTVFMNVDCLDKLNRAAAAFNAIMAEPVPAKEDAEAA